MGLFHQYFQFIFDMLYPGLPQLVTRCHAFIVSRSLFSVLRVVGAISRRSTKRFRIPLRRISPHCESVSWNTIQR